MSGGTLSWKMGKVSNGFDVGERCCLSYVLSVLRGSEFGNGVPAGGKLRCNVHMTNRMLLKETPEPTLNVNVIGERFRGGASDSLSIASFDNCKSAVADG